MQNSHDLKAEILKNNISLSEIIKKFTNYYNQNLSKTALSLFLNKGIEPKKINGIQEKIELILKKIINKENTMEKCEILTKEAMQNFKLERDPFMPIYTAEKEILMLQAHYYALENMRITAEMGLMTAITGQVGSGKSTVRIKFKSMMRKAGRYVLIEPDTKEIGRITTREILETILRKLSEEKPKRNLESLTNQVKNALVSMKNQGMKCILFIEEAQDLHSHTLKRLKRLWETRDEDDEITPLLSIILIAQPEFAYKLYGSQNTNLREVASRMTHVELGAINHELYDYIKHKCKMAGLQVEKIITKDAVDALSARFISKDVNGKISYIAYPNKVNNVMKLLMNTATAAGEDIINNEVIDMAGI